MFVAICTLFLFLCLCLSQISPIPSLPLARAGARAFSYGNKVYVSGGATAVLSNYTDMSIFNASTTSWSNLTGSTQLRTRRDHCVVTLGSITLIAGGYDVSMNPLAHVEVFDAVSETFTNLYMLSLARAVMACGLVGGRAVFAGGRTSSSNASSVTAVVDLFTFATQTWTTATLTTARAYASLVAVGTRALIAGGVSATAELSSVESYDDVTGLWSTSVAALVTTRSSMASGTAGGYLWFIGGSPGSGYETYVDAYFAGNFSKVTITQPALSISVAQADTLTIGNKLFVGTSYGVPADGATVQYVSGVQGGVVQSGVITLTAPFGNFAMGAAATILGTNNALVIGGLITALTISFDCSAPTSCVVGYVPPSTITPTASGTAAAATAPPPPSSSSSPIATGSSSPAPAGPTASPATPPPGSVLPVQSTNPQAPPVALPLSLQASNGQSLAFATATTATAQPGATLQVSLGLRIDEISRPSGARLVSLLVQTVNGTVSQQTTTDYQRTDIVGQRLSNGARLDLTVWSFTRNSQLLIGGVLTNIAANTIKHSATLTQWPFQGVGNELEIESTTQLSGDLVTGFVVAQTSVQLGDPIVTYTLSSGMRLEVLTRLGGTRDGIDTRFAYRIGPNGGITLRVPYFTSSATVDPSFQILLQDTSTSGRPGSTSASSPMTMVIIGASSGGAVFVLLAVVVAVLVAMRVTCPHRLPRFLYHSNIQQSDTDVISRGGGGSSMHHYQRMSDA